MDCDHIPYEQVGCVRPLLPVLLRAVLRAQRAHRDQAVITNVLLQLICYYD